MKRSSSSSEATIKRKIKMQELMEEIETIEKMNISKSPLRNAALKVTKMDDLLREIKKLSAQMKEETDSTKEENTTAHSTGPKKMAKKRQKRRKPNNQSRKRRLKYQADNDLGSSSFTECTDEEILNDYIENITTKLSDSEVEVTLKKGIFLASQDLSSPHIFSARLSPEIYETDSLSESIRLTQSKKKRRKYKRHSLDGFDDQMSTTVTPHQKSLIQKCLNQQYSKNLTVKTSDFLDDECEMQTVEATLKTNELKSGIFQNNQEPSQASENSDSSSNSHLGSEADDEGEESCWESSPIKQVIPWWEEKTEQDIEIMEDEEDTHLEFDLSLAGNVKNEEKGRTKEFASPLDVLCESGGYAAYANHKIRKFIQHRDSSELTLTTTSHKEKDQLEQLAVLYDLQYSVEENGRTSKVALTKTLHTKEADKDALKLFLRRVLKLKCRKVRPPIPQWNYKRRKMVSQHSLPDPPSFASELKDIPIPDSNVGNQMLRGMGWKPGQGLGKNNIGLLFPVKAVKRPRNLGFGHPAGGNS